MTEHTHDHAAADINLDGVVPEVWTVDQVLNIARKPRRTAHVCLRGDLQGEYDDVMHELRGLVTATGEIIDQGDEALNATSAVARAQRLADRGEEIRREMAKHMWRVEFEGMTSEDYATFNKKHQPPQGADGTEYNLRLISACAINPIITLEQARALNKQLGSRQMTELLTKAVEACREGGIDVPKLPGFLANLAQGRS